MNIKYEIQPADPAARRRAVIIVASTAVLGVVLVYGFTRTSPDIAEWLYRHLALRYPMIGAGMGLLLMTPVFGAAVYLFVLANRVIKSQRLPPPGQAVVRDTPVLTGADAVRRARALQLMAGLLTFAAAIFPTWCWHLLRTLAAGI